MDNYRFEIIRNKSIAVGDLRLTYSLLLTKGKFNSSGLYSIRVDATHNGATEYKLAFDITRKLKRAILIFDTLVNGTVTPCTLFDVLEDIL